MRKIKEVLRLRYEEKLTHRQIASSLNISASTVNEYLRLSKISAVNWPLPEEMTEQELYQKLYQPVSSSIKTRPKPDFEKIHQELRKKGVTLMLLWREYRDIHANGLGYTQFCLQYQQFAKTLSPVMRQTHKGGEKCYVDYAGLTIPWINVATGEIMEAEVFVGCLPASNYIYAEAMASQTLPNWLCAHENMFHCFGGVSKILVPDNLKAGVTKAHYYDPDINRSYQDFAIHYGVAVVPARVKSPRDKANVEGAVKCVEYLIAKLRHNTFTSIAEINEGLQREVALFNQKPFQKLSGTRQSLFETIDKPALKPLPAERYELAEWKKVRVNIDYHVTYDYHHYSVPHKLIHQVIELRVTAKLVECFYQQQRIAIHLRSYKRNLHSTKKEHMPKAHREYAEWSPERLTQWAGKIGAHTKHYIETLIAKRDFPEQAYRACLGILRMSKQYGESRLDCACLRASALGIFSYRFIDTMLKNKCENEPIKSEIQAHEQPLHAAVLHSPIIKQFSIIVNAYVIMPTFLR